MSADNPRLQELRRRVQGDPASIAFAQLAEECRRAGDVDEAIRISRAGLAHHPGYLSARVTLGRSLMELNQLDDARQELSIVLETAPENLAAIRAIADIHQRQGRLGDALEFYRRALSLAQFDPELEATVERIQKAMAPPKAESQPASQVAVEDLFDFDSLLEQLGTRANSPVQELPAVAPVPAPSELDTAVVKHDDADPFSTLERQLREKEMAPYVAPAVDPRQLEALRMAEEEARAAEAEQRRQQHVVGELETWLAAIIAARSQDA